MITTRELIDAAHSGFELAERLDLDLRVTLMAHSETLLSAAAVGLRHRTVTVPHEVISALLHVRRELTRHRRLSRTIIQKGDSR